MIEVDEMDVLDAMESHGGSFVSRLAVAWKAADLNNRIKLMAAFPEYWDIYTEMAKKIKEREQNKVKS